MAKERRLVPLGAAFNCRDLGGYSAAGGRTVRWGAVLRSDTLDRLDAGAREALVNLGVRTVIDLRSSHERSRLADPDRLDGAALHHIPVFEQDRHPFTAYAVDAPEPPPGELYLKIAADHGAAFAAALATIARADHAVVFHCVSGKDRTGILTALLLSALGVDDETIVADYALSERAREPTLAWARAHAPAVVEVLGALPPWLLRARPQTMRAFLAGLRRRHGSVDGYLEQIGVDAQLIAALRERLLE